MQETVQQGHALADDGRPRAPSPQTYGGPSRNHPSTPAPFATTTMATAHTQVRPPAARAAAVSPAVRILTDGSRHALAASPARALQDYPPRVFKENVLEVLRRNRKFKGRMYAGLKDAAANERLRGATS